jgi:hypothetical protein
VDIGTAASQPAPAAETKPVAAETKPPVSETKPVMAETKPDAGTSPATLFSDTPDRPWASHAEFVAAFRDINTELGKERWDAHFSEFQKEHPSVVFGPGSFQDDVVITFYRKLQAVMAAPSETPAPAPEKKKLFG